jgi:putative transposase
MDQARQRKGQTCKQTLSAICEFVGCCADAGAQHTPDKQRYIEQFFGHRIYAVVVAPPGVFGSHSRNLRRALSDPKSGLRSYVAFDELEELIEYFIANYNGPPRWSEQRLLRPLSISSVGGNLE